MMGEQSRHFDLLDWFDQLEGWRVLSTALWSKL